MLFSKIRLVLCNMSRFISLSFKTGIQYISPFFFFFNAWKFSPNQPNSPIKCLTSFFPLVLDNSVARLLTPGAFVTPQYSDCLLKLFTISFFYKWLSCLEEGRLLFAFVNFSIEKLSKILFWSFYDGICFNKNIWFSLSIF